MHDFLYWYYYGISEGLVTPAQFSNRFKLTMPQAKFFIESYLYGMCGDQSAFRYNG